ncbi:MAG: 5'-nucleotidase C-terminal domain-containing protein, partial [Clostridia bacterium]|nr:5'-nucleotidase C-terminal domain-containing protein [Clostridia bacterium]
SPDNVSEKTMPEGPDSALSEEGGSSGAVPDPGSAQEADEPDPDDESPEPVHRSELPADDPETSERVDDRPRPDPSSEEPDTSEPIGESSDEPDPAPATGVKTVTFVSVNDLHGRIEQDDAGRNGIANTALGIDRLSAYYGDDDPDTDVRDDIVLFANGDMFQGTAVSNRSNGLAVLMAMNLLRFDAMGLGNHEFDWMLDTILPYWDGNNANGEADFPLLTANIRRLSAGGRLLADLSASDNIADGVIVRKEGLRIGLISCIGPLKNSILATAVADYEFTDVTEAVARTAERLKREGADLICVSIHDGDAGGIENYGANREIALLKGPDGTYLVDVLFNGHTHTMQKGEISRPGGTALPVLQAGANNQGYGYVKIELDTATGEKTVRAFGCLYVQDLRAQCDPAVAEAVKRYAEELTAEDAVLAVSGVKLSSKRDYADYVGQIMIKACGADFAIGNYGGLRGTAGIDSQTKITLSHVYEMIPFDNTVYVVRITGKDLYKFYYDNEEFYYLGESGDVPRLAGLRNSVNYYTLAVIDYVYTSRYFDEARRKVRDEVQTGLILRDLLAEDIRCYGRDDVLWSPRKGPRLAQQYYPD